MLPINVRFVSCPVDDNSLNNIKKRLNKISVDLAQSQETNVWENFHTVIFKDLFFTSRDEFRTSVCKCKI